MPSFAQHGMLPTATAEEQSREDFVRQLSLLLETRLRPGLANFYERHVAPTLSKNLGRSPTHKDIATAMRKVPANQAWYALRTYNQERMHRLGDAIVDRQLQDLMARARANQSTGSLRLDATVEMPAYLTSQDIHLSPGGYHREEVADDLSVGAVYDRVISVHSMGSQGPYNDDAGRSIAAWLKDEHPEFQPRRILDLGCTIGHFTLPFKQAFDTAEVVGIDVAAPGLRYAHARANTLGIEAHFQQVNAEAMPFEAESFDLIVSRQFLHETSLAALENTFAECHRLLAPGGVMLHQDAPQFNELSPYIASLRDWDINCNNEPFMAVCYELPLEDLYANAGFIAANTFRGFTPSLYYVANNVNRHATRSAGGRYFFTGAVK